MPQYTLFNKCLDKYLSHPQVGVWYTYNLAEALSMLTSCKDYVRTLGVVEYESKFVIMDMDTGKELLL